jgi:hypothetical protein
MKWKFATSPKELSDWRFLLFLLLWFLPVSFTPWWVGVPLSVVVGLLIVLVIRKKDEPDSK